MRWARNPAPARSEPAPAAIMEWRESPRRIVDPAPAPRSDPGPVAGAVGRPVRSDPGREPDCTVIRLLLPLAVVVEVLIADCVVRDILRHRLFLGPACLALLAPAIEVIR